MTRAKFSSCWGQTSWSAARNLLFQEVYYDAGSAVKDGMKTWVAQGHCALLEQNQKILREGFSLCNPAHCNALCAHPSMNKRKKFQSWWICHSSYEKGNDTRPKSAPVLKDMQKNTRLPVEWLGIYMSKLVPNSARCVLFCLLLDSKDNCVRFCLSSNPWPSCCQGLPCSQDMWLVLRGFSSQTSKITSLQMTSPNSCWGCKMKRLFH